MTDDVLRHLSAEYDAIDINTVGRYRETFGRDETTLWVLNDILNSMFQFSDVLEAEEALVRNFGNMILAKCGMNAPEHKERGYIVDALFKLPPVVRNRPDEEE